MKLKKTYRLSSVPYTRATVCRPMSTVGNKQHDGIKVGRGVPPLPGDLWRPAVSRTNYWLSSPTGRRSIYPDPHGRCLTICQRADEKLDGPPAKVQPRAFTGRRQRWNPKRTFWWCTVGRSPWVRRSWSMEREVMSVLSYPSFFKHNCYCICLRDNLITFLTFCVLCLSCSGLVIITCQVIGLERLLWWSL